MTELGSEGREFGRRRALIHAIIVNKRGNRMACLVRNISDGGALLEVEEPHHVSQQIKLVIENDGFIADCEVRHRSEHAVGVYFTEVRISQKGRDTRSAGPKLQKSMQPIRITDLGRT